VAPNAWRLADTDLERAVIRPPGGFVGLMNLTLELRLADNTVVDRWSLQLEWSGESAFARGAPAESSQRHLDSSDIALLMKRGAELVANGNIGAARMMFLPAAEAGEPKAALALAETYDPLVLEKLGAKGITSDAALAQRWYEKAKALGAAAAPESLVRLTR
jgi:TPR repeat protein